jgi:hypothetical protein
MTDNTMAKKKDKPLQGKLKIEQHKCHQKPGDALER